MCGLCLPHCPTYVETRDEGESPRGRIALMHALAGDQLPLSPRLEGHLDHCLACRACEDVCPSEVSYGALIDTARGLIHHRHPPSRYQRWLLQPALNALLSSSGLRRGAARLLRLYQLTGLPRLVRRWGSPRLARLQHYLPRLPRARRWRAWYPAVNERGRVALFLGCINPVFDPYAIDAAISLLNRCGYSVRIPASQVCCGALHQHTGMAEAAQRFAARNIDSFTSDDCEAVVFFASGCGATLKEYHLQPTMPAEQQQRAQTFADTCIDINQFLSTCDWPDSAFPATPGRRIAVHDPCSMRRVLHQHRSVYDLLGSIPGVTLIPVPDNAYCCGAAGSYMLSQPELADRLAARKLDALAGLNADVVVSSNIGCALHLSAAMRRTGIDTPVRHPVSVLYEHLAQP